MKKWLLLPILLIVLAVIGTYLTDNTYIWKGIRVVWLRGQADVGIYDYKVHDTRPIKAGKAQPWELDEHYNKVILSDDILKVHEELQTTAFLVIKDGKLLTEHYFLGSHQNDRTGLWSVTKTYTTFSILKAIEDGLIEDINDPVKKYIPEWEPVHEPTLTLRHLASMSAALYWDEMDHSPFSLIAKFNFHHDLASLSVNSMHTIGSPGKVQHYNSGGTQLLGTILNRVLNDKTLTAYISEKFWQPLGCEQDALYILDSEKMGNEKSFAGMVASARDVAKLGQVLLDNGQWKGQPILQPEHVELVKTIPYNNKTYTYGLWTGVYEGERFYYQAGFKGQFCITVPAHNLVITRLGRKAYPKADLEDVSSEVYLYIEEAIRIANAGRTLR